MKIKSAVMFGLSLGMVMASPTVAHAAQMNSNDAACQELVSENQIAYKVGDGEYTVKDMPDTEVVKGGITEKVRIALDGKVHNIVPGDKSKTELTICNASKNTSTINVNYDRVSMKNEKGQSLNDVKINGKPSGEIKAGESLVAGQEVKSGESFTLPLNWEFPYESTTLNQANDGASVMVYDLVVNASQSPTNESTAKPTESKNLAFSGATVFGLGAVAMGAFAGGVTMVAGTRKKKSENG